MSSCASAGDIHDVSCCSDTRDGHGDLQYGVGSRFPAVAAVTNPLYVGAWITEGCGARGTMAVATQAFWTGVQAAEAVCAADGARLCSVEELEAGAVS